MGHLHGLFIITTQRESAASLFLYEESHYTTYVGYGSSIWAAFSSIQT